MREDLKEQEESQPGHSFEASFEQFRWLMCSIGKRVIITLEIAHSPYSMAWLRCCASPSADPLLRLAEEMKVHVVGLRSHYLVYLLKREAGFLYSHVFAFMVRSTNGHSTPRSLRAMCAIERCGSLNGLMAH